MKRILFKRALITSIIVLICINSIYSQGFNKAIEPNRFRLELSLGMNCNTSASNDKFLNIRDFYEITKMEYFQFNPYYPFLHLLQNATYDLKPKLDIDLKFLFPITKSLSLGMEFNYTQLAFEAVSVSENLNPPATAELFMDGREELFFLKPILMIHHAKFRVYSALLVGLAYNKDYKTHLIITDEYYEKHLFLPDYNDFYETSLPLGLEVGIAYELNNKMIIGVSYSAYHIGISHNSWFTSNGFYNYSFNASISYDLLNLIKNSRSKNETTVNL